MKRVIMILCLLFILSMTACTSNPKTFQLEGAEKITVISGTTGESIEITDMDTVLYITDNISGLTYEKGDKVNSDGWSYALTWCDENGSEVEKVTVLNEYTIIYDGRYYKGMEADYELDLAFLEQLFDE